MSKMIFSLILFFTLITSEKLCFAKENQWRRTALYDSATVDFPGKATRKKVHGQQVLYINAKEATYMAMIQKEAFDDNPELSKQDEFYNGVLRGAMKRFGDAKIVRKVSFEKKGFIGLEVQFTVASQPGIPGIQFMRLILVNGTLFIQQVFSKTEPNQALVVVRNHFFDSFQPGLAKTAYAEPGTRSTAYRAGEMMGSLFCYGVLIAGCIAVVRRISKPKTITKA